MASSEDCGKYFCALGSRSVRRVAAKVYAASGLDAEARIAMLKEPTQAVQWQQMGYRSRLATQRPPHSRRAICAAGSGDILVTFCGVWHLVARCLHIHAAVQQESSPSTN
jgi:hypothetical protein